MNIPTPRFAIGDTVYWPDVVQETVVLQCPDCNGTKKWEAVSPIGERFPMPCPRCSTTQAELRTYKFTGTVRALTIGSVRLDTGNTANPVEYMCSETGIGSGSIYKESRLGATEDEAKRHWPELISDREIGRASYDAQQLRNSGALQERINSRAGWQSYETAAITRAKSAKWEAEHKLENLLNLLAAMPEYGGRDEMGDKAIAYMNKTISDELPDFASYLEAAEHDRAKARASA
jgi:hypothetical protein